ncbi:MAG: hypothetical protein KDK37_08275 [Leptospiraceae bacterium]|nr:hypothetical protein [Leptospiraceae bacterium]MCB1304259.1 hypothetical protein [Leptospiraceae bacterium]
MQKNTILIALAISAAVFGFACTQKDDDNSQLALLALALSGQGQTQASQANAVSNAVSSAVTTAAVNGDIALLKQHKAEEMLAYEHITPVVWPTALGKSSGSCTVTAGTYTCDVVVTGTAACLGGGTITLNGVQIKMNGNFATSMSISQSGDISFANCVSTFMDYASGAYISPSLNGDVSIDYSGTQTLTGSSTFTVALATTNVVTNKGLTIDGANAGFSQSTVVTDISGQYSIVEFTNAKSVVSSTLTGTVQVNGATVKTYTGATETTTCTLDGSNFSCTNS